MTSPPELSRLGCRVEPGGLWLPATQGRWAKTGPWTRQEQKDLGLGTHQPLHSLSLESCYKEQKIRLGWYICC